MPKSRVLVRSIVSSGKRVSVVLLSVIRLTSWRPESAKSQADQLRLMKNEDEVRSLERCSIVSPCVMMNSRSLWKKASISACRPSGSSWELRVASAQRSASVLVSRR